VVFQADYDKIDLKKIAMTSSPLRHQIKRHQNYVTVFPNLPPLQSKFLVTPVWLGQIKIMIPF